MQKSQHINSNTWLVLTTIYQFQLEKKQYYFSYKNMNIFGEEV